MARDVPWRAKAARTGDPGRASGGARMQEARFALQMARRAPRQAVEQAGVYITVLTDRQRAWPARVASDIIIQQAAR